MPDEKLTDNEIIKAFEYCLNNKNCIGCIADKNSKSGEFDCRLKPQDIIDVFNRLQAENERLSKEVDRLSQEVMYNDSITEMKVEEAETKAYKECIEKVKAIAIKKKIVYVADVSLQEQETGWLEIQEMALNNILKELVGENDET